MEPTGHYRTLPETTGCHWRPFEIEGHHWRPQDPVGDSCRPKDAAENHWRPKDAAGDHKMLLETHHLSRTERSSHTSTHSSPRRWKMLPTANRPAPEAVRLQTTTLGQRDQKEGGDVPTRIATHTASVHRVCGEPLGA